VPDRLKLGAPCVVASSKQLLSPAPDSYVFACVPESGVTATVCNCLNSASISPAPVNAPRSSGATVPAGVRPYSVSSAMAQCLERKRRQRSTVGQHLGNDCSVGQVLQVRALNSGFVNVESRSHPRTDAKQQQGPNIAENGVQQRSTRPLVHCVRFWLANVIDSPNLRASARMLPTIGVRKFCASSTYR